MQLTLTAYLKFLATRNVLDVHDFFRDADDDGGYVERTTKKQLHWGGTVAVSSQNTAVRCEKADNFGGRSVRYLIPSRMKSGNAIGFFESKTAGPLNMLNLRGYRKNSIPLCLADLMQ